VNSDNGSNNPVPASGRRPLGAQTATDSFDAKVKGDFDPKGKKMFDGYAPGQSFKKKTSAELAGEIHQAVQEAPEAVEQQRIPKASRDMVKGFYRNLGDRKALAPKADGK
jgi:hypothetical protein